MRLPSMKFTDRITKRKQIKFGGLNHTTGAGDGDLWDMRNLTSDHSPLLATRAPRKRYLHLASGGGLFAWEKLCWVSGTDFYYDGEVKGQVSEGEKIFGCLTPYIVIFPDKCYYNVDTGEFGSLESSWKGNNVNFMNSLTDGVESFANSIYCAGSGVDLADYFRVGDAITISGCTVHPENNKTAVIRAVKGERMYFSENCFVINEDKSYKEPGEITITRTVPDLKFICENENRLWGCTDNTIYACKLGDVFNWNVNDGIDSDSWAVDTGSPGVFTGCVTYGGYPIFFKEDRIYKVYGSYPSNYELLGSATLGLAEGSHGSLAVAGEVLFYLNRSGICAYTGGIPQPMGKVFGVERFRDAVAGSDGLKYYVSMRTDGDDWRLYVYDTQKGVWHKEDELQATHFARLDGNLYCLDAQGDVWIMGNAAPRTDGIEEKNIKWMAEFADFTDDDPNKKGLTKLQIRLELDEGASVQVFLQFDSDGQWHKVSTALGEGVERSYYLPIIPRRTDHYRLKLEGTGGCKVHSLVREAYSGSELRARKGRN